MVELTEGHSKWVLPDKPKGVDKKIFEPVSHAISHEFFGNGKMDAFKRNPLGQKEEKIFDMIKEANFEEVPGNSPATKAKILAKVMDNSSNTQDIKDKLKEVEENLEKMGDDMDDEDIEQAVKLFQDSSHSIKSAVEKMLQLLKTMNVFQSQAKVTLERDPKGKKVKLRKMQDFSDVSDLDPTNYLDHDFLQRVVEYDYKVRDTYTKTITYQERRLILLLDDSGSMSWHSKEELVQLVLFKLKLMLKSGTLKEVHLFLFEKEINKYKKFEKAEDVEEYIKKRKLPNGGNTEVSECIDLAIEKLTEEGIAKEEMEILVVNDGQDRIDVRELGVKVSAITLEQTSDPLRDLCKRNHGEYHEIFISNIGSTPW